MSIPTQEEKEQRQRTVAGIIHSNGDHALSVRDDCTQIWVFINEETEEFGIWPKSKINPYIIDKVFPLPDEAHFTCWAILNPDWTEYEEWEGVEEE